MATRKDDDGVMLSITYENCYVIIDVGTDGMVGRARVLLPNSEPEMVAHDGTHLTAGGALYEAIIANVADEVRDEYSIDLTKEA
jgi:hypothetical protein